MKRRQKRMSLRLSDQGFTMVELLVAMVVSLLALAAIYSTFLSQHRSYQVQNETADMQQNIRTAMYFMQREIRMAGSDPFNTGNFGITAANPTSITFTEDISNGGTGAPDGVLNGNETITYNFADSDGDLVNDELDRINQTVAQNIDAEDGVRNGQTIRCCTVPLIIMSTGTSRALRFLAQPVTTLAEDV